MDVTREWAESIAKDFLAKKNPTNWNGKGLLPIEFHTRCCTYDFGSPYVELDVYFEYDEYDREWIHVCEIVEKESDCGTVAMCERLSGNGIDSYLNVADTILDICNTYDWFNEE
jgi:hypothetical protein